MAEGDEASATSEASVTNETSGESGDEVVAGAATRGAAGGDIRFSDVPEELVQACESRVASLLAEERSASTPIVRKLRQSLQRGKLSLPVVSTTLSRVLALLGTEDVAIEDLALAVETDPALATKVVGVANSGLYGGIDSVTSVRDALMRTGLEQAKNIVAGVAIRSSVFQARGYDEVMDAIWRRSLATAIAMSELLEDDPVFSDSAFLTGLVHDVGRIVLLATAAVPLADAGDAPSAEAVEDAGNALRCELGAIALSSWTFADEMVEAISWQERPDDCPEDARALTCALYAADTLVNLDARGWTPGENEHADRMVEALIAPFGVELERCPEIQRVIEGGLAAFTKLI